MSAELSSHWTRPVVGVLGGLGPAATVSFLDQLVQFTEAERDQDHLDAVVLQHSTVPDRTTHVLDPEGALDPAPALVRDAQLLERMDCAFVAMPCNTANHYEQSIRENIGIPLLSIVEETSRAAAQQDPHSRVGVLATEGTVSSGAYQHWLERCGVPWAVPSAEVQRMVNTLIYDQVKAGAEPELSRLEEIVDRMGRDHGTERMILGCTELSVMRQVHRLFGREELIDSLEALTRATITTAGKRLSASAWLPG